MFVFQFYPVCNFAKFISFGLGTVKNQRVKWASSYKWSVTVRGIDSLENLFPILICWDLLEKKSSAAYWQVPTDAEAYNKLKLVIIQCPTARSSPQTTSNTLILNSIMLFSQIVWLIKQLSLSGAKRFTTFCNQIVYFVFLIVLICKNANSISNTNTILFVYVVCLLAGLTGR